MAALGTALTIDMETFEKLNGFDELFDSGGHCTALVLPRPPLCSDPNPRAQSRAARLTVACGTTRGTCAALVEVVLAVALASTRWHLG